VTLNICCVHQQRLHFIRGKHQPRRSVHISQTYASTQKAVRHVYNTCGGSGAAEWCCWGCSALLLAGLRAVYPVAGPPGQQVQVLGRSTWNINQMCSAEGKSFNDNSCVGEVVFGDYLCSTGADVNDAGSVFSSVRPVRWGSDDMYAINCRMPDPSTSLDRAVSGMHCHLKCVLHKNMCQRALLVICMAQASVWDLMEGLKHSQCLEWLLKQVSTAAGLLCYYPVCTHAILCWYLVHYSCAPSGARPCYCWQPERQCAL
jgi:hypothetical protein